jgi:hypothetical protein
MNRSNKAPLTSPAVRRRVVLGRNDVVFHRGMEIDTNILDAVLSSDKRVLWAFVKNGDGNVMAVPYSEDHVIWLTEDDLHRPKDVEV